VDKNLTLRRTERDHTIIDGMHSGTVVTVLDGVTAKLEFLTIRNGFVVTAVPTVSLDPVAGGIKNMGTLSLFATVVTDNSVISQDDSSLISAGGILNQGSLNISHSSVLSNVAENPCLAAGGILNLGSVIMDHSLIAENVHNGFRAGYALCGYAPSTPPFASGYFDLIGNSVLSTSTFWKNGIGINNLDSQGIGSFTLDRSTVSYSDGDGIYIAGKIKIVNSTIYGSTGAGINIYTHHGAAGFFDMSNSTVSGNLGGGVYTGYALGTTIRNSITSIRNSIIAGNSGYDCFGTFLSGDYNLIQDLTNCSFAEGGHDLTGVPADLERFGDYGGPTETLNLKPGSPAINGGNPAGCTDEAGNLITTDQRGFRRPESHSGRCDIGAVEVQRHHEDFRGER
jgi:hypothetical protein